MVFFDLFAVTPHITVDSDESGLTALAPDASRQTWEAAGVTVSLLADAEFGTIAVRLSAPAVAVRRVHLRWSLSVAEGMRYLGDDWERGYGTLEWRGMVPDRTMPWYFLVCSGETTHGYGVRTGGGSIAWWRVDSSGVSLFLDVSCGTLGVQLGERELECATIIVRRGESAKTPFTAARAFCRLLCPAPRLPKYPVYGGNDWYYAYGNNSADSIRHDAVLIREHSPDGDNRPFMVIDDGWHPVRTSGPYDHGNEKFPDMAALAADLKAMDVRPGIWMRPLIRTGAGLTPDSWRLPETHPHTAEMQRNSSAYLDPSVPEVLDQVRQDVARLSSEWGYELIKHDFSTYDVFGRWGFQMTDAAFTRGKWSFADRSKTSAEVLLGLYRTIRDAAGDTLIIGCNTIGHLGAGLFEIQRTGDDTSGVEWERTRKMGVNTLAFRMCQHDTFFAVDADCVGLTTKIPWHLNREWLDLLARSGTPLFVSASPDAVGPEQSKALREAFALAASPQPVGEPLDWLHTTCPRRWRLGGETATYDWFDR